MERGETTLCPMCGSPVSAAISKCAACGENLLPVRSPRDSRANQPRWRRVGGIVGAVLMFAVGIGILARFAWKCLMVLLFGGSLDELWALLVVAVFPFLLGWEFLFGRKGDA